MANKIYNYCMSKPYDWTGRRSEIKTTVKKTALVFALDNGEDLDEVFGAVEEVTDMIIGREK